VLVVGLLRRRRSRRLPDPETRPPPFAVFFGLDVGKSNTTPAPSTGAGKRLHERPLPNDEIALRSVFGKLAEHSRTLVVVDQPASIGALAVAVARQMRIDVAHLPRLAMHRIADLHPGQAKTVSVRAGQARMAASSRPQSPALGIQT
jgi:hypothetical protein